MTAFDPSLLPDIANAIGLQGPAFVEKDYYAIQLLKIISENAKPPSWEHGINSQLADY